MPTAPTYTLEATADGSHQRLAINGALVSTIVHTTFSSTSFLNLGIANGNLSVNAVELHDFLFVLLQTRCRINADTLPRTHPLIEL